MQVSARTKYKLAECVTIQVRIAYQVSNEAIVFGCLQVVPVTIMKRRAKASLINKVINCNLTQILVTPQYTTSIAPEFSVIRRKLFLISFRSVLSKAGVFNACSEKDTVRRFYTSAKR